MAEKKKKKKVGSIIFRTILIVIAGLTLGLGVYRLNAEKLVGNQLPTPFGIGVSVIMSDSMKPVLSTNDLVVVTVQDSYDVDDIVVYQEGRMLVIHRIISIDGDTVITKGDANKSADPPVSVDDIKAKLSFSIPYVGVVVKFIKSVPGTLLILAVAIFLLYRSRQKERSKDMDELDDIVEEIKRLRENMSESSSDNATDEDGADTEASDPPEKADGEPEDVTQNADEDKPDEEKADEGATSSDPDQPDDSEGIAEDENAEDDEGSQSFEPDNEEKDSDDEKKEV